MNYEALWTLRRSQDLTQRELAELLGIPYDTYLMSVKRKSQTGILNTLPVALKLVRILDCSVLDLLTDEEKEEIFR